MESVKVKEFLSVDNGCGSYDSSGSGSGAGYTPVFAFNFGSGWDSASGEGCGYPFASGDGCGYGYGDGHGFGLASASGDGFGSGWDFASGDGSGDGSASSSSFGAGPDSACDIKSYINKPVYCIDDIQTIIKTIHGNIAKGLVLNNDLTTTPCFVAKVGNCFAHGNTIKEALTDAQRKHFITMDEEERLFEFVKSHKWGVEYPDKDFYEWHSNLTDSCKMGRDMFAKEHGLEKLDGKHTVEWFVELTKDAYGGEIIKRIPDLYKNK